MINLILTLLSYLFIGPHDGAYDKMREQHEKIANGELPPEIEQGDEQ
jgi:hypothetical protein